MIRVVQPEHLNEVHYAAALRRTLHYRSTSIKYMSSRTTEDDLRLDHLRGDYKGAFDNWAQEVNRLRTIDEACPDSPTRKEAEDRVEAAEVEYRQTRDLLAR